ncbi:MAG: deoxyribonuclease IV, partial [Acidimicrobiales bacterium]
MRFGAHVSAAGGVLSALDRASQMGAEVVQLHTQSPRVWRPNAYPLDLLERYAAEQEAHPTVRAT